MSTCDCCEQEMQLISSMPRPYKGSAKKYKCELCDITKVIYADHEEDEPITYSEDMPDGQTCFCRHNIPLIDCLICNDDESL